MTLLYVFFKLFIAHILGDFWLQPTHWVNDRNKKHFRSNYLLYHALIHGILALIVLLIGNAQWWYLSGVIFISHYFIDLLKSYQTKNKVQWFVIDQFLHMLVIAVLWIWVSNISYAVLASQILYNTQFWLVLSAILVLSKPAGIFIGIATGKWRNQIDTSKKEILINAGKWIGIIERILILTFILIAQFEAVGFLLAAKSIFRFGDLKETTEKNQTEYLIIGTLLSFGIAVIIGIAVKYML
jgi:hypothetical protein